MKKLLQALKRDERGVSAIEYAILAGIIVVIVAGAVMTFGDQIDTLFGNAQDQIEAAATKSGELAGGGGEGGN